MKAVCLSCLFWVALAAQLSKSTQSGASEQRGQNDYLAFSLCLSCCLSHINPLIHCYILLRCLRAVDLILRTVVPSGVLSTNTALSRLSFQIFLHEFRYSLLYWVEKPCGCLTIEGRVGKSIVDVPNQRVRHKLWVCAWKLLPVETLTALSRDKESQSGNTNNTWRQG